LAPRQPHAHHLLAHVLPRHGNWETALDAIDRASSLGEASAHHSHLRAIILLRLNRFEAAEAAFQDTCRRGDCGALAMFLLWNNRPEAARESAAVAGSSRCRALALAGLADLSQGWIASARKKLKPARSACRGEEAGAAMIAGALSALIDLRQGKKKNVEAELLTVAAAAMGLPVYRSWSEGLFFLDFLSRETLHAGDGEIAAELALRLLQIDPGFRERAAP
jgi:hypothetical protein